MATLVPFVSELGRLIGLDAALEPVINFAPVMEVLWGVMPELFILEG